MRNLFFFFQSGATNLAAYILILASCLLLGLLCVYVPIDLPLDMRELSMLVLLTTAAMMPFNLATIRRRLDIFEPIYFVALLTFVYFVVTPIALTYREEGFIFLGVNHRPELSATLFVALVGLLGFYIGYFLECRFFQPSTRRATTADPRSIRSFVLFGSVITTILVCLWIQIGNFPLRALNVFDERTYYTEWRHISESSIGYLYAARFSYLPLLILSLAYRKTKTPSALWITGFIIIGGLYVIMGVRIAPLTLLMATSIYLYLERGVRPRMWHVVCAVLFFFFFHGVVGMLRRPGEIYDPLLSWENNWDAFLAGNSLVLGLSQVVFIYPNYIPFQLGSILLSALLLPMPRILWPSKPSGVVAAQIDSVLFDHYTPPLIGSWYADFGIAGSLTVMILLGVICAKVYRMWQVNSCEPSMRVLLAVTFSSLLMIYTRDTVQAISWSAYLIGPVLIARYLGIRQYKTKLS